MLRMSVLFWLPICKGYRMHTRPLKPHTRLQPQPIGSVGTGVEKGVTATEKKYNYWDSLKNSPGLIHGQGLLHKINLTIFLTPWSYQWGHGLIFGEGINTPYTEKMLNSYTSYTFVYLKQITLVNIVTYKVDF